MSKFMKLEPTECRAVNVRLELQGDTAISITRYTHLNDEWKKRYSNFEYQMSTRIAGEWISVHITQLGVRHLLEKLGGIKTKTVTRY